MPKFEAVIDLTVEIDADNADSADQIFLKEFTDEILTIARDKYKIWLDIRQIEQIEESK
jgi:hypothetical protein